MPKQQLFQELSPSVPAVHVHKAGTETLHHWLSSADLTSNLIHETLCKHVCMLVYLSDSPAVSGCLSLCMCMPVHCSMVLLLLCSDNFDQFHASHTCTWVMRCVYEGDLAINSLLRLVPTIFYSLLVWFGADIIITWLLVNTKYCGGEPSLV